MTDSVPARSGGSNALICRNVNALTSAAPRERSDPRGRSGEAGRYLLRSPQRLRPVLTANAPPTDVVVVTADRAAGIRCRLPLGAGHRFPTAADDGRAVDAARLVALYSGGGRCELQVCPDQVHVFQALPRLSPEAAKTMAHVARFIDNSLRASDFDATSGKAG